MILDKPTLRRITGKVWRSKQVEVLVAMGIEHVVRPDGEILVSVALVERLLTGQDRTIMAPAYEPDWSALAQTTA